MSATHFLKRIQDATIAGWDKPAFTDIHKESFLHKEVAEEIEKLHIIFKAAGIKKGDRIAFAGKNCSRWAIGFLAAATDGCVAVPILNDFTPANIQELAAHAGCKAIFTEKKIWGKMIADEMPDLDIAVNLEDFELLYIRNENAKSEIYDVDTIFAGKHPLGLKPEDIVYACTGEEELAIINYTSGTTGNPKGIMLPARAISSNVQFGLDGIPIREGDTSVAILPLAHMYGLTFEFLYKYCGGCHIHFLGKTPSPSILMMALAEVKPYQIITVPLVIEKIIKTKVLPTLEKNPAKTMTRIPFLRSIVYARARNAVMKAFGGKVRDIIIGGAAISSPVEIVLRKMQIPYTVGYGMTECGPIVGYAPSSNFTKGSCGRIVDRMEIRVDSANPQKEVGELQVRGDNVMLGYYKNEDATRATFTEDGWLRTGDLGIVDGKGNIFIKGRSKCMILSSNGQNIYPEEIESKLNSLDLIGESIVVARDKALVAIVSLADRKGLEESGADIDALLEAARRDVNRTLPAYSQLSKLELVEGEFVHTPKRSIKRILYK